MIASSKRDIEVLKEGGNILAGILRFVASSVRPGVKTSELDRIAEESILSSGGSPSFKGYKPSGYARPYPCSLCTSVNSEIVHAVPGEHILKEGDLVGLDIGMKYKGFFTDTAITVGVGMISVEVEKLLMATRTSLEKGIRAAVIGGHIGDIGNNIETYIKDFGYGIIRELVGHGVGKEVHEDPQIPNFGKKGTGEKIIDGMVLAIEPMISMGSDKIKLGEDNWAYKTKDDSLAAHFEHTIIVTKDGPQILTK